MVLRVDCGGCFRSWKHAVHQRATASAPLTNIQKLLRQVYTYIYGTFLSLLYLLNSDYLLLKSDNLIKSDYL